MSFFFKGFWSLRQPDPAAGECVDVTITEDQQSWELTTCESLLPFMCKAQACPAGMGDTTSIIYISLIYSLTTLLYLVL